MSILAAEANMFPANLLADYLDETGERRWWAIYTKSRQEKALARELLGFEVPFYLPLIPKDNMIRGRRVRSLLPLFGGYVFGYGTNEERVRALTTNRISRILPVEDGTVLCRELQHVERLLQAKVPISLESRLDAGQRVRVKTGPFKGIEGIIISRRGSDRLLVSVNYLQQGVSMEVNDFVVEPL